MNTNKAKTIHLKPTKSAGLFREMIYVEQFMLRILLSLFEHWCHKLYYQVMPALSTCINQARISHDFSPYT